MPKLGLPTMLLLELGRRWYVGEGICSSALSKTDKSVALRDVVGLWEAALVLGPAEPDQAWLLVK